MSGDARCNPFSLLSGGAELLDRIEPLWWELRRHHAELLPRWAGLLAKSFEERRDGVIAGATGGVCVVIASADGRDIGYCLSAILADGTGEIHSFYVIDGWRRRGVGNGLISATMNWLAGQSVTAIALNVLSGNDDAVKFYARYGFSPRTVRLHYDGNVED